MFEKPFFGNSISSPLQSFLYEEAKIKECFKYLKENGFCNHNRLNFILVQINFLS